MGRIAGIDLGTTYSALAVLENDGSVRIIENREGEKLTPSAVNFDEHGTPVVGTIAREMSIDQPDNTVQYVKRNLGEKTWKFEAENGETFSSEEISALILKRLKDDAEAVLGEPLGGTVITVPAYFDDARRTSVLDAARIAGIDVLGLVNEPTAAALAYGCDGKGESGTVAVFDLGGGTFDVTVVRSDENEIRVLATGGDRNLGGFDFDNALVSRLNEEFAKSCELDLLADTDNGEAFLRERAEGLKRALSQRKSASVLLAHSGKRCKVEITEDEFRGMTAGLMRRALDIAASVFEDALGTPDSGMSPREAVEKLGISKILLVGGSTKMPVVSDELERETGIRPSRDLNPDEAVAIGAAIYAGLLATKKEELKISEKRDSLSPEQLAAIKESLPALPPKARNLEVFDVNSHSLGIVAIKGEEEEFNAVILPRNTPVPAKVSKTFYTLHDNQTNLFVQVTEGEEEDISLAKILGEAEMKIAPKPKSSPVEVEFRYDANSVVHVGVTDSSTGEFLGEVVIKRTSNLDEAETEEARRRMSRLSVD